MEIKKFENFKFLLTVTKLSNTRDTHKMNENLRHLYRDTIVGEAYMKTLNELVDELGGVDEEIKEKMACIFEEVRRRVVLFFRFLSENHVTYQQNSALRIC